MLKVSIDDVKETYNSKTMGHWFSKDTMRFFKSRLSETAYLCNDHYYFISSEKSGYDSPRRYSVRSMDNDCNISTIGEFQEFATLREARSDLARYIGVKVKDM